MKHVSGTLYRGSRPSDDVLLHHDIKYILSLELGFGDDYEALDFDFAPKHRIGVWHIGSIFGMPPSKAAVKRCLGVIGEAMRHGQNALVSCPNGSDRAGFIVAAYRMQVDKWTFEQAYAEWVAEGRTWYLDWWKFALRRWSNQ